jgi:hypothetical protein
MTLGWAVQIWVKEVGCGWLVGQFDLPSGRSTNQRIAGPA